MAESIALPWGLAQPADLSCSKAKWTRHRNGRITEVGAARNGAAWEPFRAELNKPENRPDQ